MTKKFKPFADIDDFYAVCGIDMSLPAARIQAKLLSASLKVASTLENHGYDWVEKSKDDFYALKLKDVVCSMAFRALQNETQNSEIPFGATQFSTSADGFSQQVGFQGGSNVSFGELYLSKAEKQLLGLDVQKIGFISMLPPDDMKKHKGPHHERR